LFGKLAYVAMQVHSPYPEPVVHTGIQLVDGGSCGVDTAKSGIFLHRPLFAVQPHVPVGVVVDLIGSEVLFGHGTKFEVLEVTDMGTYTKYVLKEVP